MRIHLAPTTICQEWTILLIFGGNLSLLPTCVRNALPTWLRRPHQPLGPSSRWEDLLAFARLSIIAAPSDPQRSHRIHIRLFLLLPHPLPSYWFGRSLNSSSRRRRAPHVINKRFLPIVGGQKAAASDSAEGWHATGNLAACRMSIRMDDRMDGQRADRDGWRDARVQGRLHLGGFRGGFILPLL
jgi:hypothetical protein